jgi:hypothetical protein
MRYASLTLFAVLLLAAAPLHAQIYLDGAVLEAETGAPVVGAIIEVVDRAQRVVARAVTDPEGLFTTSLQRDGAYRLRANRLGFQAAITPLLHTDGYDHLVVEIRLDPEAVLLAPLEILGRSARAISPVLEGFTARARVGLGYFITRDDIENRRPGRVTDLLASVPGVSLESSGTGTRRTVTMSRSRIGGMRNCPVQVFIDGRLLNRSVSSGRDIGLSIDDVVSPGSVEGIEVYRGISGIPAEFLNTDARCGVVAIWTRRGA